MKTFEQNTRFEVRHEEKIGRYFSVNCSICKRKLTILLSSSTDFTVEVFEIICKKSFREVND